MIQGGGFAPNMAQKQTREPIVNEAANGLKNTRGTLAMARTPDPNSASSQFFINLVNNDFLNFKAKTQEGFGYCVFGKVVTGMSVVDAIAQAQTGSVGGHQNVPLQAIVIKKASVVSAAPAATKP
jgi:peptidyl-prolyl cis-trans isomerase B (cyclophilin B)